MPADLPEPAPDQFVPPKPDSLPSAAASIPANAPLTKQAITKAPPNLPPAPENPWIRPERPALHQTLRNLRVWLPFLANPAERRLQVRFSSDLDRVGLVWKISLPRLCWHCGKSDALRLRQYEYQVRSFEYALGVVVGTAAAAFLAFLLALYWFSIGAVLLLIVLLGGAALLYLKSWTEEVKVTFWTCEQHAGPMRPPGMVIDDQQLFLFLANAEVMRATLDELQERRRFSAGRRALGATGMGSPSGATPPRETSHGTAPAPRPAPPKPVELPPIKLAGDE
jgi:hypothetical protein